MIDMEDLATISPYKFNEVFPDPQDYCIGAVLPPVDEQQNSPRWRQKDEIRLDTV